VEVPENFAPGGNKFVLLICSIFVHLFILFISPYQEGETNLLPPGAE